jgi:hypothetical protein
MVQTIKYQCFFPGQLWYLFELTKMKKWKPEAQNIPQILQEKLNGKKHMTWALKNLLPEVL